MSNRKCGCSRADLNRSTTVTASEGTQFDCESARGAKVVVLRTLSNVGSKKDERHRDSRKGMSSSGAAEIHQSGTRGPTMKLTLIIAHTARNGRRRLFQTSRSRRSRRRREVFLCPVPLPPSRPPPFPACS